jgi:hypothetical protein
MSEEKDSTVMDSKYTDMISIVLQEYFLATDKFIQVLKNTGSIIAGGSILSIINNYPDESDILENIKDFDIYTHREGAKEIVNFLYKYNLVENENRLLTNIAPAYDESFLRANNIKIRIYFKLLRGGGDASLDIMIVDDGVSLPGVVSNFDLTFCQVYFDGENIKAFHPSHILEKSGFLEEQYVRSLLNANKFTIKRIKKYNNRGFKIRYNTGDELCGKVIDIVKKKTPVSMEEWLVKKIYKSFADILAPVENILSRTKIFVNFFLLLDFTFENLFELLRRTVKEKCFIPPWLLCLFNGDNEKILKASVIYYLTFNPFLLTNKLYRDYSSNFIKKLIPEINNAYKFTHYVEYLNEKRKEFSRSNENRLNYYTAVKNVCVLNKLMNELRNQFLVIRGNTRKLEYLNHFTVPTLPSKKVYPEKKLVDEGNCFDLYTFGLNNINAYLKGEKVEALTIEGNRPDEDELEDYDLPAVPPEEARKRLVFFLEQTDGTYKPICYNLDMIEKSDMMSNIFSTTCGDSGSLANIINGLGNPLFRLNLGDFSVHVFLKELLGALYLTKKQVFILQKPTPPINFPRTASLSVIFSDAGSWVSADHCQDRSDKSVYRILLCEEKDGNLCYPIIQSNDIEEVDISEFTNVEPMNASRYEKIKTTIFNYKRRIQIFEQEASLYASNGDITCSNDYEYNTNSDEDDEDIDEYDEE